MADACSLHARLDRRRRSASERAAAGAAATGHAAAATQQPTFRVQVDLVTTDVIARDGQGSVRLGSQNGRVRSLRRRREAGHRVARAHARRPRVQRAGAAAGAASRKGIILPAARPTNDAAGRVFLIFIDDLHLDFRMTPRTRDLMKRMLRNLIHDGDMFGIVSTGTSSISEQLTYDRQVLESAISGVTGSGLRPEDIIKSMQSSQGHPELRYRAHVAFSTAYQLMRNLESLRNRRKAVIYISSGYDFNPFETSRLKYQAELFGGHQRADRSVHEPAIQGQQFAEADLVRELAELTRAANRANATLLHDRPARPGRRAGSRPAGGHRGMAGTHSRDAGQPARAGRADRRHRRRQPERLRQGAEAHRRRDERLLRARLLLDNPDPLKRTRRIEVKTKRNGVKVWSRTSYTPAAAAAQ